MTFVLRSAFVFVVSVLTAGLAPAAAQGFGFAPTIMEINPAQSLNTEATLYNSTNTAARFSITTKTWTMVDGISVLTDSRDLLVNPTSFTIPAGGSQTVRVGLRKKPSAEELTYRIIVQQLPLAGTMVQLSGQADDGKSTTLNVALAFSLPVYVATPNLSSKVVYSTKTEGQDLIVTVSNQGNRHATFNNLVVTRSGAPFAVQSFAVLRGATYTLRLAGLGTQTGGVRLNFRNENGDLVNDLIAAP